MEVCGPFAEGPVPAATCCGLPFIMREAELPETWCSVVGRSQMKMCPSRYLDAGRLVENKGGGGLPRWPLLAERMDGSMRRA